jgi:hypothetical protein
MTVRHRIVFQLLIAAFLLGIIARPTPLWACSCIMPSPPPQAFTETEIIFTGQVTNISNTSQLPFVGQLVNAWASLTQAPVPYSFYENKVSFAVIDSWKGVTTTSATVSTSEGEASCGFTFTNGQQYVVYAYHGEDGGMQTNICTRTTDISNASADLAYLNTQPTLPLSPAPLPILPIVAGVGFLAVLGLAGFWIVRRSATRNTSKSN